MNMIKALDNNRVIVGEKGHHQYDWSEGIQEKITEFYFQLVRTKDAKDLNVKFCEILNTLSKDTIKYEKEIILLYKITANTRDVKEGKGEMDLCWMQLLNWWKIKPELAYYLVDKILYMKGFHQYGSWKDIKYLCDYIYQETSDSQHAFIEYLIKLTNFYLRKLQYEKDNNSLKLLAKWIPREKSKKFGWIFNRLAFDYNKKYLESSEKAKDPSKAAKKARQKCKMEYRKLIAKLNRDINTVQINMCNGTWRAIKMKNITSKTMSKNREAFLNLKKEKYKYVERSQEEDRKICATNLKNHLELKKSGKADVKINGQRCDLYELVRDACVLQRDGNQTLKDVINAQWDDNRKNNFELGKIIPLVDVSGSMECDEAVPLYNAIGLGIRISEVTHPAFKNRIMTFSANPTWLILNDDMSFCEKVYKVRGAEWGMNTDLYKSFRAILDVIKRNEIPPDDVKDITLAIFSDMQIDQAIGQKEFSVVYDNIKQMFEVAGLESKYKVPYETPHILFWNLRKTNGFPSNTTQKNTTMLSGYNSSLLNIFQEKGVSELQKVTPIVMLNDLLDKDRYAILENGLKSLFEKEY